MKIKMQTLSAGPAGIRQVGQTLDVSEKEARDLIDGHYAVAVEVPAVREAAPVAPAAPDIEETAAVAPPENAARRTGRTAARK
jgi:hypothetical protein